MNNFIYPRPVSIEEIAYRWVKKQMKMQKLKHQIAECVKNDQMETAKKYAAKLQELEESPLVNFPNPCVCY